MRIISIARSLEIQGLLIYFVTETVKGERNAKSNKNDEFLLVWWYLWLLHWKKYMASLLLGNMIEKGVSKTEKRKKGGVFPSIELALF